jgi:hypothetical protein
MIKGGGLFKVLGYSIQMCWRLEEWRIAHVVELKTKMMLFIVRAVEPP